MIATATEREFDVVFADTCLGGSTVAARVGLSASGLRGFFLADYAVNPLGVKPAAEVRAALEGWICAAAGRSDTLVVACNTASVLLEAAPDVLAAAGHAGLRVVSMVHLLDRVLARNAPDIRGRRVCLMGTRFTVGQTVYRDRLTAAGAAELWPLAATRTERIIAHMWQASEEGRREIVEEVGETVQRCDVVVLACTLFPLVAPLLHAINPKCVLVDPAAGVDREVFRGSGGTNRLTIAVTGDAIRPEQARSQAATLFPGWSLESIETGAPEGGYQRA